MPNIRTKDKTSKRILDRIKGGLLDPIVDLLPFSRGGRGRTQRRQRSGAKPGPRGRFGPSLPARRRKNPGRGRSGGGGGRFPGNRHTADPGVANFATPASFARVENNTTFLSPERSVIHPELGVAGVSVTFAQPLCDCTPGFRQVPTTPIGGLNTFFGNGGPASVWPTDPVPPIAGVVSIFNFIDLNPSIQYLGGPLSTIAQRYLKYRFNDITITYTTAVGTNQPGSFALCICDDPASAAKVATSFNAVREVVPNLIAPYRIPEACLRWDSNDKVLYFVETPDFKSPGDPGSVPDARQTIQATLCGRDSGLLLAPGVPVPATNILSAGYFTISGNVEFYEPIPPTNQPATAFERMAVEQTLLRIRGGAQVVAQRVAQVPVSRSRSSDAPVPVSAALIEEFALRPRQAVPSFVVVEPSRSTTSTSIDSDFEESKEQ